MKSLAITIFVSLVVLVLVLEGVTFQVRQTESVLVTTFGKPTGRQIYEPGLHFKWPPPIQNVYKFDSRMRVFEADLAETTTKGAVPIIVHTYVVWRIADPLKFLNSVASVTEAENKLHSQLNDTQNNVIGRYYFSDFVNSDKSRIQIMKIQQEMLETLSAKVAENYGIKIEDLGIKQLKIPADVSKDVFERMRAERNRKTESTVAEGRSVAVKIKTDANSMTTELLAAAEARAKTIMGQGDAEAARYYQMLEADPSLAIFLRDIEALEEILRQRSTFIISTDEQPFSLLRKMPELTPEK